MKWWEDFRECLRDNNKVRLVQLLKRVIPKTVQDRGGESLLSYAIRSKNLTAFDYLIEYGCDPNVKNLKEETPLHIAITERSIAMVNALIDAHCDVNIKDAQGNPPLVYAIKCNETKIVEILLKAGADTDNSNYEKGFGPLHIAAKCANVKMLQLLIAAGCKVTAASTYGRTPLLVAVANYQTGLRNHYETVEILIEANSDVNASNYPLSFNGGSILHYAAEQDKDFKLTKLLLSKGAQINDNATLKRTPLHWAVMKNNYHTVKGLIEAGCDVNCRDVSNCTNLHMAMRWAEPEMVQLLLDNGASIHAVDDQDQDPFSFAVWEWSMRTFGHVEDYNSVLNKHDEIIEFLAIDNVKDQVKCLKMLLKEGSDINRMSQQVNTPLTLALEGVVHSDVISFLLRNGAIVDFRHETIDLQAIDSPKSKIPRLLVKLAAIHQTQSCTDQVRNFNPYRLIGELSHFYRACRYELEEMKQWAVNNKFSMYDLLVQGNISLSFCNEQTVELFTREQFKPFPIYFYEAHRNFKKAMKKKYRLDQAREGLSHLLKWNVNSFFFIYDDILKFLSKKDLVALALI